jgi:hypothetical protein
MSVRCPSPARVTPGRAPRRGVAAVIAMIYMVLFASLAVGFYATTTISAQVAGNDRRIYSSQLACESGMEYIRYQLGLVDVPRELPQDKVFEEILFQLEGRMLGTPNMAGKTIGYVYGNPSTISIPDGGKFIQLEDKGPEFRAVITEAGQRLKVRVTARGRPTQPARAIEMQFAIAQNASNIFEFGVASKGSLKLDGNSKITGVPSDRGSILLSANVANPLVMTGNASISGDVSFVNPYATISRQSTNSVAGSTISAVIAEHTHEGVKEPEFPQIDTDAFKPFAGNVLYGGTTIIVPGTKFVAGTVRNVYVKKNTNPVFDGTAVCEGVLYVETPNHVQFLDKSVMRGVIAVQNFPTGTPDTGALLAGRNSIRFDSNARMETIEKLPTDSLFYPPELLALKGTAILAPNFYLWFNSNFGGPGGAVIGSKIKFDSNAIGQINGSLICLDNNPIEFNSNANVTIAAAGTTNYPAGVFFGHHYAPLYDTYRELLP